MGIIAKQLVLVFVCLVFLVLKIYLFELINFNLELSQVDIDLNLKCHSFFTLERCLMEPLKYWAY